MRRALGTNKLGYPPPPARSAHVCPMCVSPRTAGRRSGMGRLNGHTRSEAGHSERCRNVQNDQTVTGVRGRSRERFNIFPLRFAVKSNYANGVVKRRVMSPPGTRGIGVDRRRGTQADRKRDGGKKIEGVGDPRLLTRPLSWEGRRRPRG